MVAQDVFKWPLLTQGDVSRSCVCFGVCPVFVVGPVTFAQLTSSPLNVSLGDCGIPSQCAWLSLCTGNLGRTSGPALVLSLVYRKLRASKGGVCGDRQGRTSGPLTPPARSAHALPPSLPPPGAPVLPRGKLDLLEFNICPVLSLRFQTW